MYKGGPSNTEKSAAIIRYAGILVPIILIAYGTLIGLEIVPSDNFVSSPVLIGISVLWMIVGLYQFFAPQKSKKIVAFRLTIYHLLAAAYLLFVTGISTPFVASWVILLVVSGAYFSTGGVLLSVVACLATIGIDIAVWHSAAPAIVTYNIAILIAVLFCGLIAMAIVRAQGIDHSELNRSREQEYLQRQRVLTIMNSLTDAVLSIDKDGIVRLYNAASLNLLDTNKDLEGHHIDEVLPLKDGSGKAVDFSKELKKYKTISVKDDVRYEFEDGESIRLELTISPIRTTFGRDDALLADDGYIFIARDVTKEKSLEEERDEFISVVSHELRTPITIVEGTLSNLELILQKDASNQALIEKTVTTAHEQTVFLAKMVNDLSTLSRAERGVADSKEVIDVKELAHKLFESYAGQAEEKGLKFNLDIGTHLGSVISSRLYLEELLQNFITNAIKYTKEGSVTLRVTHHKNDVTFTVKDTGIGISKTDKAKIFEKFYRSEDYRTRETGGTGLGLYVATKLARKIDTHIEMTSRLNHGSSFSITLPVIHDKK